MQETIVVQETDGAVLDTLTQALEMEGFNVYPLLSCDEGFLDLIDNVRPHVIILDYKLDGTTCMDICQKIKVKFPHLPVIAMSCNSNIHQEYDKNGFDGYIKKPFDLELLYRIVREHIDRP
jgi:DNA-binding response OmpR family regulator